MYTKIQNITTFVFRFGAKYTMENTSVSISTHEYRTLQLLANLMNSITQNELNTMLAYGGILVLSLSEATLVKLAFMTTNVAIFLLFLFLLLNSYIGLIVIFTGFARVHESSNSVLKDMKRHMSTIKMAKDRKQRKCFHNSCSSIKVYLGSVNFVDSLTPLNFINFANNLTVQIVLVGIL